MATWITSYEAKVGEIAFYVERHFEMQRGRVEGYLWPRPAHTNRSHEPRLEGWCGTTNNISLHACGVRRVTKVTRHGRALLAQLTDEERDAWLAENGWPELIP